VSFTSEDVRRIIWTAIQAFLGAFIVLAPGIWLAPNLEEAKAAALAALAAGVAAALSALKNGILGDSSTIK
jgi:hypothetical protein